MTFTSTQEKPMSKSGLIAALILSLASFTASAHDARVSWSNAVKFTNETLIADATGDDVVASTTVEYGSCNADGTFGVAAGSASVAWAGTTADFLGLPDGTFCFHARHTTVGGINSN